MTKHILLIVLFLSILVHLNAQNKNNKQYRNEFKKFMRFIRDTEFKNADTLICRNYLCNKQMFGGVTLFGYGRFGLSEEEKNKFTEQARGDTSKLYISKKLMKRTMIVADTAKGYWEFSKPVFLRSYLLCAFSYGDHFDPNWDSQKTFLYKKENGNWSKLFEIGSIKCY